MASPMEPSFSPDTRQVSRGYGFEVDSDFVVLADFSSCLLQEAVMSASAAKGSSVYFILLKVFPGEFTPPGLGLG